MSGITTAPTPKPKWSKEVDPEAADPHEVVMSCEANPLDVFAYPLRKATNMRVYRVSG